jgi:hypothetical protein
MRSPPSLEGEVIRPLDLAGRTHRVNELHASIESTLHLTVEMAIECGSLLTEIKDEVGHGQWEKWAEANLRFTVRHARRYMRVARLAAEGQIGHECPKSPWAILAEATTREGWLESATSLLAERFREAGYEVPPLRVGCAPLGSNTAGVYYPSFRAADRIAQIYVAAHLSESYEVCEVLAHEMAHAIVGPRVEPHRDADFKRCVAAVGLDTKRSTETPGGPAFRAWFSEHQTELGPYPHAALRAEPKRRDETDDVEQSGDAERADGAGAEVADTGPDEDVLPEAAAFLADRLDKIDQCEFARLLEASRNRWARSLAKAIRAQEPRASRPPTITEFLAEHGGLRPDDGGELRAVIGAGNHFVPRHGALLRDDGMPLDTARECAEEASYLSAGSDINALLALIRDDVNGRRRFADRDISQAMEWQEQQRTGTEALFEAGYVERGPDGQIVATNKFRQAKVRVR